MSAPALFKQADLERILRAAEKVGVPVRIEIEAGRMLVVPIDSKAPVGGNSFDGMFA